MNQTALFALIIAAVPVALALMKIIAVVLLTAELLRSWFLRSGYEVNHEFTKLAFTLLDRKYSGEGYSLIQGVFDQSTNTITSGQRIRADDMDQDLKDIHAQSDLAVYQ